MTTLASRIAVYWPLDTTHGRSLPDDYYDSLPLDTGVAPSATGKVRQCLSLDSSLSHFRSRLHHADLSQPKGACFWVKFTTLSGDMSIISKGSDATDNNTSLRVWYDHSDTDLAYTVGTGSASTTVRTDGLSLAVDTWYFVRAANDGNRMSIWVNETLYGSATAVAPLSESGALYLGRDFGGNYLNGLLDEVVVFSSSPTAADGHVFYDAGNGGTLPVPDHRVGTSGQPAVHHRYEPPTFAESGDGTAYLAQGHVPAQRISGTVARAGVPAPQTSVRPRGSGAGTMVGTVYAYSRWLDADGRVSNVSPISDRTTLFGSAAATITAATNASPIVITSSGHGLSTGARVGISGQLGNTAANGTWTITNVDANTFSLDGSVGNGDWLASEPSSISVTTLIGGRAGTNEVQSIAFSDTPTTGTFTLSFRGETTSSITYDATASTIQSGLEALSTIGSGNVLCAGGPVHTTAVTVTFQNVLQQENVPLLESTYTGAAVTVTVAEVTAGSINASEVQTLDLLNTPTGGTFTVTFDGQTTGNIAYNASAATVDTALEALSNIGAGDVTVTDGPLPGTSVTVSFTGNLAETNVAEMTIDPSNLTGAGVSMAMSTTTPGVSGGGWDVSTGSGLIARLSATSQEDGTTDMAMSADGTKAYVVGVSGDSIYQYTLSTAWDVSTGSYASKSLSVASQETSPVALAFSVDGTKAYIAGVINDTIYQYTLSTAWDVSTGSYASKSFSVASTSGGAMGMAFSTDGTKLFVLGGLWPHFDTIFQYTLDSGGGTNEVQRITTTGTPTEGSFTLSYEGQTTSEIAYNATASTVDAALESLSTIGSGDVSCTGGALPGAVVDIEFTGALAETDVNQITIDDDRLLYEVVTTVAGTAPVSEVQSLTVSATPTLGTWTVTHGGVTTNNLDYDATAVQVQDELETLSSIGAGNVTVSGGPINTFPMTVSFGGTLSHTNLAALTTASTMVGNVPPLEVSVTTEGTAGQNKIQELAVNGATGGTFTLTFGGESTAAIEYDASAAEVQAEFQSLAAVGAGKALVYNGPLAVQPFQFEYVDTLGRSYQLPFTAGGANLLNGGWSQGADSILYRDVPVPTDTRVVKRQILRSKAGVNPNVVYVDIETSDVSSNRLTSNNTDADMTEAVVLLDSNGVDSNLSRHGEPPDWKRVVVGHQNRLFYLVDYVETSRVDVTTPTATGIGTDWPSVFDDRVAYDDTGSAVIDVDPDNQTGALTLTSLTAEEAAKVTIRKQRPDGQRMYHSWVTSVDSFPESVHAGEPFQFPRDPRDGEPVSAYSFDGQFFVAFEQATYRHTFAFDPAPSPSGDGRAGVAVPRGMVSSRSWASVDDNAWVMDRQGIYIFDGDALVQVSEQIKTLFTGMDGDAINWENRKWFHAAHFAAERTVRFFVTLDGGPYPRHALCCNVDQRMWWIEEYSWPITSSCEGVVAGKRTVFLGSTRRQIFTLDGLREGMSSTLTDTLRGDVTSAGTITLADTSATFSSSLVGHTIRIVKGPGIGLQREIVAVSGTTLTVKQPWTVLPTTDSTYQIAGVSWSVQTGMLRYVQNNQKPVRRVEIDYSPNTAAQNMDYRILEEFSLTEMVQKMTVSSLHTDGISMEADSSRHRLDLTQSDGHAEQDFGGISPEGVTGDRFVSVLADGTTNGERHRIHALAISGAQ